VDVEVDALIELAVATAKAAPEPSADALLTDVYVTY
jgi:pyruvate dehydrogenase E1 component alpha subunit